MLRRIWSLFFIEWEHHNHILSKPFPQSIFCIQAFYCCSAWKKVSCVCRHPSEVLAKYFRSPFLTPLPLLLFPLSTEERIKGNLPAKDEFTRFQETAESALTEMSCHKYASEKYILKMLQYQDVLIFN